jgi:hypothetical protein
MEDDVHDPQFWLMRAAKLHAEADAATDANAAKLYREIAADYERIADLVATEKTGRVP